MTKEIDNEELTHFLASLEKKYGYDFKNYSKTSFKRRITKYLTEHHYSSFAMLAKDLLFHEEVFVDFLNNITVNVTEMFRDPWFFKKLREQILPQLASYPFIKIWHAGCSTGEEVYSTAIILKELGLLDRTRIYATDINYNVIQRAKEGFIPLSAMKDYTQNYIQSGGKAEFSNYYKAGLQHAVLDEQLRKTVTFSFHNLVTDQSFNEFHLILCRNVLIYFDRDLQNNVIKLFTESLHTLGFLALGTKETISFTDSAANFEVVDKETKIYRRIS